MLFGKQSGGKTLQILSRHLALRGRLVIVGGIAGYKTVGFAPADISDLPARLLMGSQSMTGFLLTNERDHFKTYLPQLITMVATGKMQVKIDRGNGTQGGPFKRRERCRESCRTPPLGQK